MNDNETPRAPTDEDKNSELNQRISHPHDQFFKRMFSETSRARDLLETYLPVDISSAMDWQTLQFHSSEYIDPELTGLHSDLLYSVQLHGEDAYIYTLIEHQSKSDPLMAFRLLKYMVAIWQRHLDALGNRPKYATERVDGSMWD